MCFIGLNLFHLFCQVYKHLSIDDVRKGQFICILRPRRNDKQQVNVVLEKHLLHNNYEPLASENRS